MLKRYLSLKQRRRNAAALGIPYSRDQTWVVPSHFVAQGKEYSLMLPSDQGTSIAFKDIFLSDVYGLDSYSKAPDCIIDIGAHVGLFSLAARLRFPDAIIHAYEPNPQLSKNLNHHAFIGNFTVFHEAVGVRNGHANLIPGIDSVFTQVHESSGGTTTVTAFSTAIERLKPKGRVSLLKLDCEGAEWDILQDGNSLALVDKITLEYHLDQTRKLSTLTKMLEANAFAIEFLHEDGITNGRIRASR